MAKKPEETPKQKLEKEIASLKDPYKGVEWVTPGLFGYEINYKGVYSHEALIAAIVSQFKERGFKAEGGDFEVIYEDRTNNGFRQIQHIYRAKKSSELADLYLHITLTVLGIKEKEVLHEGQKIKMHSTEIIVWLRSGLKPKSPLDTKDISYLEPVIGKNGEKLFDRFYLQEQEAIEEKAYDEAIKMMNIIRLILGLPVTKNPGSFMFQQKGAPMLSTNAPSTDPKLD